MPYQLIVETDRPQGIVTLGLRDDDEKQLGSHQVRLADHSPANWEGLFDTRRYVLRYQDNLRQAGQPEPETAAQILDRLGVFLGQQVLGEGIMAELGRSPASRPLLVKLPDTAQDLLAAAFARVPWEIARSAPGQPTLMERNLVVRAISEDTEEEDSEVVAVARRVKEGEPLKALLVFAETPGSRPLAMRLEREELLRLFYREILPKRRVQVDVLCHGVTREILRQRIQAAGGYHVLHWSGHGYHNLLELPGQNGGKEYLSGEDLMQLFMDAGGFIPPLVFLSACLSGTLVNAQNWSQLQAALTGREGEEPAERTTDGGPRVLQEVIDQPPGYTGTALALLRSGVPQVVAIRYEVGDNYARELAAGFYRHLLADDRTRAPEDALALARGDLLRDARLTGQLAAVDHATPLFFGQAGRLLDPVDGRSEQLGRIRPRPHPLLTGDRQDLDPAEHFVGRGQELTRLHDRWLAPGGPAVALVQGLAGLGKTALAAEAVHLWHQRFDLVLAFQARANALGLDEFYRQLDGRLTLESGVYADRCRAHPNDRIHLEPGPGLTGPERYERMRNNLLTALGEQAILLALDNFESNLAQFPDPEGYRLAEPPWADLLAALARALPQTPSRLLVTSRHRPAVLAGPEGVTWLPLGPLPLAEAGLYLRSHPGLRPLLFGGAEDQELARRLLEVSRGHPLILDRLATLAGDRASLTAALDRVQTEGYRTLPDLFAAGKSDAEREQERQYLEEVAVRAVDLLLERQTPQARRLLWVVTQANEPVTAEMLQGVWSGQSLEEEQLERIRPLHQQRDRLPQETRQQLEALPPQIQERLSQPAAAPPAPPVGPLLEELCRAGLLTREAPGGTGPAQPRSAGGAPEAATAYAFHELVRERTRDWMAARPEELQGRAREQVWVAYGRRYRRLFASLRDSGRERAREAAAEAGRRGLVYLARAGDFAALGGFASVLVTGTRDPALLRSVTAELQAVAEQAPPGRERWVMRLDLADSLRKSGQLDQALDLYRLALTEAEAAGHWADVAVILGNWANALRDVGRLDLSRETYNRLVGASAKAERPQVYVVAAELEAYRIDVMQGRAEAALPEIEARLTRLRGWWERHRSGEMVPEAPDGELLGRVMVSGLDIARSANEVLERWQACLDLLTEEEEVKTALGQSRQDLAITRSNRYGPLIELGQLDEAQRVLEECLWVFRQAGDLPGQAADLSALADVWYRRGDIGQAIALERQVLAVRDRFPNPRERAIAHSNLSSYLQKAGQVRESAEHRLAGMLYYLTTENQQNLATAVRNLGIGLRSSADYRVPRVAELLAAPEFDALRRFLAGFGADLAQLQAQVDQLVAQAGQPGVDAPAGPPQIPEEVLAPLRAAVAAGQDLDQVLAQARNELLQQAPGREAAIDAFLQQARDRLSSEAGGGGSA